MHPTSRATKAVTDGWIALEDEEGEEEEGGDDEAMWLFLRRRRMEILMWSLTVTRQTRSLSFFS